MDSLFDIISNAYANYAAYFWRSLIHPFFEGDLNYFYYLILVSLAVWGLEILLPWRKKQAVFRKDFWLDAFYMFFNFFFFNLLLFTALSDVSVHYLNRLLQGVGIESIVLYDFSQSAMWLQFIVFFLLSDFIQWSVHNLLHRVDFLWQFHKVHHSVKEMGFAAHLRYHFMETVVYNSFKYLGLVMLFNFDLKNAFLIHGVTILIGHLNHANLDWDYGPLKYILNNPKMHIWHHAKELPASHPKGMNFGISLSLWDYIFGTDYIPHSGRDIALGFDDDDNYPQGFMTQLVEPFKKLFSSLKN